MIIRINGNISAYFIQTLCLLFFPGAAFPENEPEGEQTPIAEISVCDTPFGAAADVALSFMGKKSSAQAERNGEIGEFLRRMTVGDAFIRAGGELLGFRPPWGMMTGVRPAKLASARLELGESPEEAARWLEKEFFAEPGKARLAAEVAEVERRIITPSLKEMCSVYVAIPFCPSRCSYCSFVSYSTPRLLSLIPEYLEVLIGDIKRSFARLRRDGRRVATVYIGGGTPTVLSAEQLELLLSAIELELQGEALLEYTVEAGRPDTVTAEKLAVLRRHGVDRISVNTQTLNDSVLASLGRRHTADGFLRAYELAVRSGIPNINVDLIAALPGEDIDSFRASLSGVAALSPANITVHTFTVKKSAELRFAEGGSYSGNSLIAHDEVSFSEEYLKKAGYIPYYMYRQKNTVGNLENVGWCRPGHEGIYNICMMEEIHSIYASGASSVTKIVSETDGKLDIKREFAPKYPYEYLRPENKD